MELQSEFHDTSIYRSTVVLITDNILAMRNFCPSPTSDGRHLKVFYCTELPVTSGTPYLVLRIRSVLVPNSHRSQTVAKLT